MNKDYILINLREAKEELERTISEIENDPEYGHGDYVTAISHLYHHINTAWNARDASERDADECTQENFDEWRKFPDEEEVLLVS